MQQVVRSRRAVDPADDDLGALIAARRPGYSLPAALYTGAAAFEADISVVFHHHWIVVGVEADVPEPGDVYAVDIGPTPIILVRDDEGQIRAFHNVCSHRGAKIVPSGRAIVGKLVCPYHQWTYELTGELTGATHMGLDFDKALHHLQPVALRNIGGLIYVCLSNDPPEDIAAFEAIMGPRLAPYDLANTKIAYETDLIEEGNWKLTMENNRECYHCAGNHPELALSYYSTDLGFDPSELSDEEREQADWLSAQYAERTALWEACGLPSSTVNNVVGHPTQFRTQRLIIAGAGESQTLDTRAACRLPLSEEVATGSGDTHLWTVNGWNHFMGDHAVVFTVLPLGPDKSLLRTKWLVHKDAVEGEDYDLANLISVWVDTNREDADLVRIAHQGAMSAGYRPGPYSRFTERTLDEWSTWYVERMQAHGYGV
ncbi:aromatic ring-hydroxylating oxygenase subunit alpha [Acuticoccus sediminis]|uniref:aromatic ring-hydroxylating oxygenase subunit alpha n=1 Tax=Acuticoccus sediminis TaxID=2184697 RepID=UPI001CFDD93A|nr:aromatic ring-hydroxylating dioxygenase subunit alpha [Acuticoccus sediminis]